MYLLMAGGAAGVLAYVAVASHAVGELRFLFSFAKTCTYLFRSKYCSRYFWDAKLLVRVRTDARTVREFSGGPFCKTIAMYLLYFSLTLISVSK